MVKKTKLSQPEINQRVLGRDKKFQKNFTERKRLRDFRKDFKTDEDKMEYIKPLPSENADMYAHKINTYEPFNVVSRTVDILSAKPFQSPATIDSENDFLKSLKDNFNGYGLNMTRFLMKVFLNGLWDTQSHVFVDNVSNPTKDSRPILNVLNNDNILQVKTGAGGELLKIRFMEYFEEDLNEFESVELRRVKIYKKNYSNGKPFVTYSVYEENVDGDMKRKLLNEPYGLDYIPLVSFNPMDVENVFFPEKLIFDPMCRVNKQMLQKDCDLNNIVSIICFPLLVASGFDDGGKDQLKLGPYNLLANENEKATIAYVEHTGSAVNTGFKYVDGLIQRMNSLGFEMLTTATGNITATSKAIDSAGNNSMIANFAVNLTSTAKEIVEVIKDWKSISEDEYYSIDIKTDFSIKTNAEDMNALIASHSTGAITNKQFVFELKRRGIVDDELVFDDSSSNNIENITYE